MEEYKYGRHNLIINLPSASLIDIMLTDLPKSGGATSHALPLPAFLRVACGGTSHYVPDRRILFKKSLMVLKYSCGSPEFPYTPESHNPFFKKV